DFAAQYFVFKTFRTCAGELDVRAGEEGVRAGEEGVRAGEEGELVLLSSVTLLYNLKQ
ncbi:14636_t:CDS:1, partial [Ambispora leptoticha]